MTGLLYVEAALSCAGVWIMGEEIVQRPGGMRVPHRILVALLFVGDVVVVVH